MAEKVKKSGAKREAVKKSVAKARKPVESPVKKPVEKPARKPVKKAGAEPKGKPEVKSPGKTEPPKVPSKKVERKQGGRPKGRKGLRRAQNIGFDAPIPEHEPDEYDPNCPFFGTLSVRGRILKGTVVSAKMHRTIKVVINSAIMCQSTSGSRRGGLSCSCTTHRASTPRLGILSV